MAGDGGGPRNLAAMGEARDSAEVERLAKLRDGGQALPELLAIVREQVAEDDEVGSHDASALRPIGDGVCANVYSPTSRSPSPSRARRPLHPARRLASARHQRRHPGAERGDARVSRLLGQRGEHAAGAGAAGFASAHHARVHAWVRVDGGWRGADPGAGGDRFRASPDPR